MTRRKQPLITRLLWLAVFGKEDLMPTLYLRATPKPGRSGCDPTRSKA